MGTMGRAVDTVGFWIRETGQALDRLSCRLQGNYFFREQLSRHRTLMNVFDKKPFVNNEAFVAPSASIIGDVQVGHRSSIWYGCVLRGDVNYISIGSGTMGATISTTSTQLSHQTQTHFHHHQLRHFAKWVPYKPLPKPKVHQKLRAIKTLKTHLQDSYFVSPFPCHGFSANKFKPLKTPLSSDPSAAKLVFVKNSLVSKAFFGTQFEALGSCMKGMNSLLFVKKEDAVGPVLGGVKSAVKEGKMEFNDFPGAIVGGQLYGHLDLEVFQSTPSKMEANGMVLGSLFGPSSTLMAMLERFCAEDSGNVDAPDVLAEAKDVSESPAQ